MEVLKRKRRHHVGKDGGTEEEEKALCRACQATSLSHPDALVVMQLSIDHLAMWKCCIQSIKPNQTLKHPFRRRHTALMRQVL